MNRCWPAMIILLAAALAAAGTPVAQQMPIQGFVTDDRGGPLPSGDVAVRIFAAAGGGAPVYDSAAEFAGAVTAGRLDIVVGAAAPLLLDDAALYWLELQVGDDELIGDAAAGRWSFRPGPAVTPGRTWKRGSPRSRRRSAPRAPPMRAGRRRRRPRRLP
ncbi:MAG: hypothetical protein IPM94_12910 [bacterium]|nr:hypothetical protein [bacterium]